MNYPKLVLPQFCKVPIDIILYQEGISEDGEPLKSLNISAKCNFQDGAKVVLTDKQKRVAVSAQAFFDGDIAPELSVISSGEVVVFGMKRRIVFGAKARNLDGTVNYTRLDLE